MRATKDLDAWLIKWVRRQGDRPEVLEGRVALEGLGERLATLGAELVVAKPSHTVKEG